MPDTVDAMGRVECPACKRWFAPDASGAVRGHRSDLGDHTPTGPGRCPGSGQRPQGHVHRCSCGATWDENADA